MFCIHCGKYLPDNSAFCDECGKPTQPAVSAMQQTPPAPVYAPVYTPAPAPQEPKQPSMKWFGFLVIFFLFFNATSCIISGVTTALGLEHENAALLYHAVPGLQIFEILFGLLYVLLGAFGIVTRFRLSGRYRNGPQFLTIFFIASGAWEVLYLVGDILFAPGIYAISDALSLLSAISGIASSLALPLVMLFVNRAYFKKRQHLFTK